jgi:hypothetical protein
MLKELGIGSTLWSVSRGLARSIADYKTNLMAADEPRQGDLDGRGNLSRKKLIAFCEYFLSQCLDQVRFMERLVAPSLLSDRTGQRITKSLIENGYLHSEGHIGPLLFAIPSGARDRWFPSLYASLPTAVEHEPVSGSSL